MKNELELDLQARNIDKLPADIGNLINLTNLYLDHTKINDAGLTHIGDLAKL